MGTEVIVRDKPSDLITLAIEKGSDLDKLEKLLAIQERYEANKARNAYNEAMASFKANAPEIIKDRTVSHSGIKYNHASLGKIIEAISAELSRWGLSASWRTNQNNNQITLACRISHKLGHFEETSLTAAPDTSGAKNSIQAIGSTVTYLQRYTLLALTGLATMDQDDDGAAATTDFIDDKQMSQIMDFIADKEVNIPKFCEFMKIESIEKMPKAKFQQAVAALQNKKKGTK